MSVSEDNLYGVFGVPATVTAHELKRAYRRMQRSSHPDTGGSAEHFRIVQEAWAVLGTPDRRQAYDRTLGTGTTRVTRACSDSCSAAKPAGLTSSVASVRYTSRRISSMTELTRASVW